MKPTSIEWPQCPECGTVLNDWNCFPASVLMSEDPYYTKISCAGCRTPILIRLRMPITFDVGWANKARLGEEEGKDG